MLLRRGLIFAILNANQCISGSNRLLKPQRGLRSASLPKTRFNNKTCY